MLQIDAALLPNASNNGCALFASRVVLYKLGVTDYGIYNAVGRYGFERIEAALVGMW